MNSKKVKSDSDGIYIPTVSKNQNLDRMRIRMKNKREDKQKNTLDNDSDYIIRNQPSADKRGY